MLTTRSALGLALAGLAGACTTQLDEGATRSVAQGIIGGESANPADFPSVVALETTPGQWFCTGTLISAEWVLTAAHCVAEEPGALNVRFGDDDANSPAGGTVVAAAAVHSHTGFDWNAWDNDIALVKLASPVTAFAPTAIHREPVMDIDVLDVGYGVADNNDGGGGLLRKVAKRTADCAGANDPGITNANLVCMDASDGRGSCFGDSGGPTFATINGQRVVVGVTSGGTGELCGAGWDLYTSVHGELDFIDGILGGAPSNPNPGEPNPPGPNPTPEPDGDGDGTGDGDDSSSMTAGCSASGGSGGFLLVALAGLFARRRRSRR